MTIKINGKETETQSADLGQAKKNVDNILYMIGKFGYMPNGTHKALLNRSQPPYSSMMARSVYERSADKEWLAAAYPVLEKEYGFWMSRRLAPNGLNRYGHCATDEELTGFYGAIAGRLRTDRSETICVCIQSAKLRLVCSRSLPLRKVVLPSSSLAV